MALYLKVRSSLVVPQAPSGILPKDADDTAAKHQRTERASGQVAAIIQYFKCLRVLPTLISLYLMAPVSFRVLISQAN